MREGVEGSGREEERGTDETSNDCPYLNPFRSFRSDEELRGRCTFLWIKCGRETDLAGFRENVARDVRYPHSPIEIVVAVYRQRLLLRE